MSRSKNLLVARVKLTLSCMSAPEMHEHIFDDTTDFQHRFVDGVEPGSEMKAVQA